MPFFEDVDSLEIVETHIQKLQKLEQEDARRLLKEYKRIRQDLRDRLDVLPSDTFTAQQLRGVLVQVEAAISAMERSLIDILFTVSHETSQKSIEDLLEEIERFEDEFTGAVTPIDIDQVLIATDTRNFLINRYESSVKAYSADVRQTITQHVSQAAIEEISMSELIRRLSRYMIGEEWKLQRIARTELHHVYNLAKMRGMGEIRDKFIPNLKKTLIHPMDGRTGDDSKKLAQINPIIPIDEPFRYNYKGKERVFSVPPDRPNDRAILVPYREEWDS